MVGRDAFSDIWNSEHMRRVRRAMLEGKPVSDCAYCYRQEASEVESLRFRNNREWMQHYQLSKDGLFELAGELGTDVDRAPAYLQLSLGNECNLKCRMCCSDYSSQIAKDPVHRQWAPKSNTVPQDQSENWYKDDHLFLNQLIPEPKVIRKLYVTGGEPMMSKRFEKILNLIIEHGFPGQVDIHINSNGTVCNRRILERLVRFKAVMLGCSIDAYKDQYEYLRYPGKWETVLKTLDAFREYEGINVGVYPTIQAYNALNITALYAFCDVQDLLCTPHIMYGPEQLTVLVMPQAARDVAADRLERFIESPAATEKQKQSRELAVPVADYLRHAAKPNNIRDIVKRFAMFTNDLDRSRGQDFKNTHEELFSHFISSGLGWCEEVQFFGAEAARHV